MTNFQDFPSLAERSNEDSNNLKTVFDMFETEKGSGRITPESLQATLSRMGNPTSHCECVAVIKEYDTNGNGELDYQEFYEMMMASLPSGQLILNLEDLRKLQRILLLEEVKSRLRLIEQDHILHSELIQICSEACRGSEQAVGYAKILEDSGFVIRLNNIVFLRPQQVLKAIQGIVPVLVARPIDPRVRELEEMEKLKAAIDKKAEWLARWELCCCGMVYLIIQTAIIMILAYQKLSWNALEPICYCITCTYSVARLAFFLRTSREPFFKGLFKVRFSTMQKRLMKVENFNLVRYNELLFNPNVLKNSLDLPQVVKAIMGLVPVPLPLANPTGQRAKELEELEKQKAAIQKKAEWLVRRELWCGMVYFIIQTAIIMILTYKKLSWNVMEPICYCITCVYSIARLAFFLKTSREPSFSGLFETRFSTKQNLLMKTQNLESSPSPRLLEIVISNVPSSDHSDSKHKKKD